LYQADKSVRLLCAADLHSLASDLFDNRCAVSDCVDNLAWRRLDRGGKVATVFFFFTFFFVHTFVFLSDCLKTVFIIFRSSQKKLTKTKDHPASRTNVVLLSESLAKRHDKGEDVFGTKKQQILLKLAEY
jgi:hypothetical protein